MTTRRYTGTCQCGRIRYEADIDVGASWDHQTALIKPSAFKLLAGAGDLEDTQFGQLVGHNQSCRHCGIRPFGRGRLRQLGGAFYAINLSTIDELTVRASAPG